jgi:hypothetical protein
MTLQSMNPPTRAFDIGNVISNVGRAIGGNPVVFFGLGILLVGVPTAAMGALQYLVLGSRMLTGAGGPPNTEEVLRLVGVSGIGVLLSLVTSAILQAAVIWGVVASLRGRVATFGECLSGGVRYFLPALGIAFVAGLALTIVGLLTFWLLFIPAVILAVVWMVAVPVAVAEDRGVFGSLGRSAELTKGARFMIWLLWVIWIVVYFAAILLAGAISSTLMAVSFDAYVIASNVVITPLLASIVTVVAQAGIASIYYELRQSKEGIGADDLAMVFE